MISPTWMYMAQHGFYGVVYPSKMAPFETLSGPTWILWLSVPILQGPLPRLIRPPKNGKVIKVILFRNITWITSFGISLYKQTYTQPRPDSPIWRKNRSLCPSYKDPFQALPGPKNFEKNPSWPLHECTWPNMVFMASCTNLRGTPSQAHLAQLGFYRSLWPSYKDPFQALSGPK